MVIDRQTLIHYCDLIDYISDTNRQIEKIASDIERIDRKLKAIENGEKVTDKVYGGEGGWQGFIIEGIPVPEYDQCKTALLTKRIRLNDEYKQTDYHISLHRTTVVVGSRIQNGWWQYRGRSKTGFLAFLQEGSH